MHDAAVVGSLDLVLACRPSGPSTRSPIGLLMTLSQVARYESRGIAVRRHHPGRTAASSSSGCHDGGTRSSVIEPTQAVLGVHCWRDLRPTVADLHPGVRDMKGEPSLRVETRADLMATSIELHADRQMSPRRCSDEVHEDAAARMSVRISA